MLVNIVIYNHIERQRREQGKDSKVYLLNAFQQHSSLEPNMVPLCSPISLLFLYTLPKLLVLKSLLQNDGSLFTAVVAKLLPNPFFHPQ